MTWTPIGPRIFLATYEAFGFGPTNALAFPMPRGLAVLSPPSDDAHFAFFEVPENAMQAIIAPHSGHTLGLAAWHERFPLATVYAPSASIAEVVRKVPSLGPVKRLEDLQNSIDSNAESEPGLSVGLHEVFESKNGSMALVARSDRGSILYADEFIINCEASQFESMFWILKQLFYWSGSVPGLRVNRPYNWFLVQDRRKMARTLLGLLKECERESKETIIVPSHGALLRTKEELEAVEKLLTEWAT